MITLGPLDNVMFYVKSVDDAATWYCDTLGFAVVFHAEGEYAVVRHPVAGKIALHKDGKHSNIGCGPIPYFSVTDIDASVGELKAGDVEVADVQTEGAHRFTQFKDCDGNRIGLQEI